MISNIVEEFKKYILLIKKHPVANDELNKILLAGLEAIMSSIENQIDTEQIKDELYKYLDNPKPSLAQYMEVVEQLQIINSPVTAGEIPLILAGIDGVESSQEFSNVLQDNKLDFLTLFKVFAKFMANAAALSSSSEAEIDSQYPGLSEDMDFTGPDGKKVSRKYKILAKFFKLLAQIFLINAYILNAVAGASKVLNDRMKDLYKITILSLKKLQKTVDNNISNIEQSIRERSSKTNEVLNNAYNTLLESSKQLDAIYGKLEHQVKFDYISEALHNKQEIFAPLLDPKNRDFFTKVAQNTQSHDKQDQFTGLTGILNTRPDLNPLRDAFRQINSNVNDMLIMVIFAASLSMTRETSRFTDMSRRDNQYTNNPHNGIFPAASVPVPAF